MPIPLSEYYSTTTSVGAGGAGGNSGGASSAISRTFGMWGDSLSLGRTPTNPTRGTLQDFLATPSWTVLAPTAGGVGGETLQQIRDRIFDDLDAKLIPAYITIWGGINNVNNDNISGYDQALAAAAVKDSAVACLNNGVKPLVLTPSQWWLAATSPDQAARNLLLEDLSVEIIADGLTNGYETSDMWAWQSAFGPDPSDIQLDDIHFSDMGAEYMAGPIRDWMIRQSG